MKKIKGLTEEEALYLCATLGSQKKTRFLSPAKAAFLLKTSLDAGEEKIDLKSKVGVSVDMINKILRLSSIMDENIISSISWQSPDTNQISMSSASELARLRSNNDQQKVFKSILEYQFTSKEVKELVTLYDRSGKNIEECINQIKKAKPKTIHSHLIIGKLTSSALTDKLSSIPALKRNRILRDVLNTEIPLIKYKGAKLKKTQFIIVGNQETESKIRSLGDDFEDIITQYLINKLRVEK